MRRITVMSYNVRSCRGTDGRHVPERIAEVIAAHRPDVVALQELDVGQPRSGGIDQPAHIAERLRMHFCFCRAFTTGDAHFGHAVLSRFPLTTVHSGALPTLHGSIGLERRAALWVELHIDELRVQLMSTHLGLLPKEQHAQVDALLSSEWLGDLRCSPPIVLVGDLNAGPGSGPHRQLSEHLRDAWSVAEHRGPRRTWPSPFALISIDHVFVSQGIRVLDVRASAAGGARRASDHRPVIAELELR
jgi:endonuclease/exonuclease/phosphatase family metal-dependent hydrolase